MEPKVKSDNPFEELVRELLLGGLEKMIEEVHFNRVFSTEWDLCKTIIYSSIENLEKKHSNKQKIGLQK